MRGIPIITLTLLMFLPCLSLGDEQRLMRLKDVNKWLKIQIESRGSPKEIGEVLQWKLFPQLRFEEISGQEAINVLGKMGFYCGLSDEKNNILKPDSPRPSSVGCIRFLCNSTDLYGRIFSSMYMEGWQGDGTNLIKRFEQLSSSKVINVKQPLNAHGVSYWQSKEKLEDSIFVSQLVEAHDFFKMGSSVRNVSRHAMTKGMQCRINEEDIPSKLECITQAPNPCFIATIGFEINKALNSTGLSLWSNDSFVQKKEENWECLNVYTTLN